MSSFFKTVKNRIFHKDPEITYLPLLENEGTHSDRQYNEYIRGKIRRECFLDTSETLSHWVPYLLAQQPMGVEGQILHTWSPVHKSDNIDIREDNPFVIHRHPISLSTDCARGKQGYSRGVHIWKIVWPVSQRGTHAVIGVSTDKAMLQFGAYVPLVGLDTESWGWDIVNMDAVHDAGNSNPIEFRKYPNYSHRDGSATKLRVPETVYVILDMDRGSMSFVASGRYLGVAHTGLVGKTLYPVVSAVWGHCEIGLRFFNEITATPPTLKSLSLFVARKLLKYHCQYNQNQYRTWFTKQLQRFSKSSSHRYVVQRLDIPQTLKALLVNNQNLSLSP